MDKHLYKFDELIPEPQIQETQFAGELIGMFQTVSTVPTVAPKTFLNQIQIYVSGGTKRLYVYDKTSNAWMYCALT